MSTNTPTLCEAFGCSNVVEFIVDGETPGASARTKLYLCSRCTKLRKGEFPHVMVQPVAEAVHTGAVDLKLMALVEDFATMRDSMVSLRGFVTDVLTRVVRCEERISKLEPKADTNPVDVLLDILAGAGIVLTDEVLARLYGALLGNEPEAKPDTLDDMMADAEVAVGKSDDDCDGMAADR